MKNSKKSLELELTPAQAQLLARAALYGLKGPNPVEQNDVIAAILVNKLLDLANQITLKEINNGK